MGCRAIAMFSERDADVFHAIRTRGCKRKTLLNRIDRFHLGTGLLRFVYACGATEQDAGQGMRRVRWSKMAPLPADTTLAAGAY